MRKERRESGINVNAELLFMEDDLRHARAWWKRMKYDDEDDAMVLMQAALAGIIEADIGIVDMDEL